MVLAATAGTAFLSGRQLTLFFSQLGGMSWLAVATAAALFGLCCGTLCRFARQTGGENVAAVLMRRLDPRTGAAVGIVHALLRAVLAGIMLCVAGHMAALLWMVKNAFWMGTAGALLAAALLRLGRGRTALGWIVLALGAAFYLALAMDGREVQYAAHYEVTLLWRGSAPAALVLGAMHAALNACAAAGAVVEGARSVSSPAKFGAACGVGMLGMLAPANAALLRGGEKLTVQAMPTVLLAARWGQAGFVFCAGFMALRAVVTLSSLLPGKEKR